MAHIELLTNGHYRIRVPDKDMNGKRINRSMTYTPKEKSPSKIKKEVENEAYKFEERIKNGLFFEGDKITFSEYIPIWREQWAKLNLTQHVLEGYEDIFRLRALPVIGNLPMSKIKPTHIQGIISEMLNNGRATATANKTKTAINSVMKYACDMQIIHDNPCERVRVPKTPQTDELHVLSVEQVKRFFEALEGRYTRVIKGHVSKSPKTGEQFDVKDYIQYTEIPFQWRVYFNLAICCGFRRGEICALKWSDIDWDNKTISVKRAVSKIKGGQIIKEPKTKSGKRTISLDNTSYVLLREWYKKQKEYSLQLGTLWKGERGKKFDENYIFIQLENGLMINVDTPTHKFKEIIEMYNKTCENDEDKLPIIRLHDLRHTCATLLISSNKVDISTVSHRLGHANTNITLSVYTHYYAENDKNASDVMEEILKIRA